MLRIILMLSSIVLILYGWSITSQLVSIIGACVFLFALIINLYNTYFLSKKYNNKKIDKVIDQHVEKNVISRIEEIIEGIITIASLAGSLIFHDKGNIYSYPCLIIWMGVMLIYFISGVVIREVANIPLRWAYGGWKLFRPKYRKK